MSLHWIALNSINGLGPVRIQKLISLFKTPEQVFAEGDEALRATGLIGEEACRELRNPEVFRKAEQQIIRAERLSVRICTIADKEYPYLLKNIYAPPPVLYIRGGLKHFPGTGIGIVGTRQATSYGIAVTEYLVKGLVSHNITVVSGMALGIDAAAHKSCIAAGGVTVAVLGCGVDVVYPPAHDKLAVQIAEKGAIVSEFGLGTQPASFNFPRRNRIIAGLTSGTVVVEAGNKSGALITAYYALQQGRDVFAVPGSIFSDKSRGTFGLLKRGAIPVREPKDIVSHIQQVKPLSLFDQESQKSLNPLTPSLTDEEQRILSHLSATPRRFDIIAADAALDMESLFSLLLNLELKGCVKQLAGNQYITVH